MSTATMTARGTPRRRDGWWLPLFFVASVGAHVGGFWLLSQLEPPQRVSTPEPVELVMVEVEAEPPPPAPEPEPEPEPEPVAPPPKPVVAARPPPVQTAPPERPVEPPPEAVPPPSNDAPPPEPAAKPPPLVVGISMSSTSSAGDFAAPVGNTVYGKTATTATDPADVKGYQAPKDVPYVPVYEVDRAPMPVHEVKATYPQEARIAGVEGSVVLSVTIAEDGTVSDVRVVKGGLGHGLEAAAQKALYGYRFSPATRQGKPVSTTIRFTYTWLLD